MIRRLLAGIVSLFAAAPAMAQPPSMHEKTRENLMVVVRESMGANRTEDAFVPTGKVKVRLPDGREMEAELASWEFIGDTHVRFVFDGSRTMMNATPDDLRQLGIRNVDEALTLALANLKRVYGRPAARRFDGGIMEVVGKSPDLDSSYFLDRAFWIGLLKKHPEGVVVSVAKRGGLLYAPLTDTGSVERLKRGVAQLHASSERLRISSALFLFKDGRWSVFQGPVPQ